MNNSPVFAFTVLIFALIALVGIWKVFQKAGQPGWGSIIPFYSNYLLVKIAGKPNWWFFLFFLPLINIAVYAIIMFSIGKNFGRSGLFSFFFMLLFPIVGYLVLGFGNSVYMEQNRITAEPTLPPEMLK